MILWQHIHRIMFDHGFQLFSRLVNDEAGELIKIPDQVFVK